MDKLLAEVKSSRVWALVIYIGRGGSGCRGVHPGQEHPRFAGRVDAEGAGRSGDGLGGQACPQHHRRRQTGYNLTLGDTPLQGVVHAGNR